MQVIKINTPTVSASKNKNILNKQCKQNNNQVSFSAKRFENRIWERVIKENIVTGL